MIRTKLNAFNFTLANIEWHHLNLPYFVFIELTSPLVYRWAQSPSVWATQGNSTYLNFDLHPAKNHCSALPPVLKLFHFSHWRMWRVTGP